MLPSEQIQRYLHLNKEYDIFPNELLRQKMDISEEEFLGLQQGTGTLQSINQAFLHLPHLQHVVLDDKPHSSQWWRQKKDELTNIQKLLIQATELASFIQTSQKDQKPNESLANT